MCGYVLPWSFHTFIHAYRVYVQTEPPKAWYSSGFGLTKKREEKPAPSNELEKMNKVLSMHSQLMKRYEKEVKTNMTHVETISSLNYRIVELERKSKEEEEKVRQLQTENVTLQRKVDKSRSSNKRQLHDEELTKLKTKCEKYVAQNKKLKAELKGLDPDFFDEVEDVKFALRQSAKLNKEYERTLRKLCGQFAVPYPNPERVLEDR
ncbi:centrosomal protein of 290 kDa-like isoform X2 [Liolophura sinensis]|uniref:centrosomal protein of 290 kDa-like isoform X2 n=1 Tax=Liolophura sinensis TaxID=3198878 RepID=UPI003158510E